MAGAFIGQVAAAELGDPVTDEVRALIRTALDEDLRYGPDVTSMATVAADAVTDAAVVSRGDGVIAGVPVVLAVFDEVIGVGEYTVTAQVADGTRVGRGDVALAVHAPTRALLTAERTALNLICHLSGIATTTAHWVDELDGTAAPVVSPDPGCWEHDLGRDRREQVL